MSTPLAPPPWRARPDAGQWRAVHDGYGASAYEAIVADDGTVVALVVAHGPEAFQDAPPTHHHARLLRAAPELLAGLKKARAHIGNYAGVFDGAAATCAELDQLIAKAGEQA